MDSFDAHSTFLMYFLDTSYMDSAEQGIIADMPMTGLENPPHAASSSCWGHAVMATNASKYSILSVFIFCCKGLLNFLYIWDDLSIT